MATQKGVDKWKAKEWLSVQAPKLFNEAVVGEMPVNEGKLAVGRNMVVSLDYLTHNPSHAFTNVVLKVTDVSGATAHTRMLSMEQVASYVRSFVRRYRSVSSAIVPVVAKDGTSIVVKLIIVTTRRTATSKIKGLRQEAEIFTRNYFKENEFTNAVNAVIEGKFQAELTNHLSNIVDLNKVEVRKLEVEQSA